MNNDHRLTQRILILGLIVLIFLLIFVFGPSAIDRISKIRRQASQPSTTTTSIPSTTTTTTTTPTTTNTNSFSTVDISPSANEPGLLMGRLYVDNDGNLYLSDGNGYTQIATQDSVVQSVGGLQGAIVLGNGLTRDDSSNTISNSGVTSVQGVAGDVTLSAGSGISINGTTISADAQALTEGTGIDISGSTISVDSSVCTTSSVCSGYAASSGSSSYIQNGTSLQASSNFRISGTGTADTSLVSPTINGTSAIQLNGTSINTAGTLSNVAYLNQANTFSNGVVISPANSLTVGTASSATGSTKFNSASGSGSITLSPANPGSSSFTLTLPAETGTICTTANVCTGYGSATGVNLQVSTPGSQQIGHLNIDGTGIFGTSVVSPTINATTGFQLNGTNINTGGTLSNVAYEDQANNFSAANTFSAAGTALTVTNNASVGGDLGVTGTITSGLVNGQTISSSANFTGSLQAATTVTGATLNGTSAIQLNGTNINTAGTLSNVAYLNQANTFSNGVVISPANSLTVGTASSATGSTKFNSASGSGSTTLTPANPGSSTFTLTLPAETGTLCTTGSVCSGYAASSGSGNYIQNGASLQSSSDFHISGTGTADTSLVSPTLNGTTAIQLNGTSINTAGTLSNVAYLNQANTFSAAGTALTVTNNASVGGNLGVTGTITSGLINGQTISSSANFTGSIQGASTITAPTLNGTTAIQLNGTNINTGGTLSNVAYLDQANNFSAANTFSASGTALTVTNDAQVGGTLGVGTTPSSTAGIKVDKTIGGNCLTVCYGIQSTVTTNAGLWYGYGVGGKVTSTTGSALSAAFGLVAQTNTTSGGTIANNYGIWIAPQTAGTSNFGLGVAKSGTQTVWINTSDDSTVTPDSGIGFGISRDTNLYRSAANTLKTDDTFVSATALQGPSLDVASAGTLSIGTSTATAITLGRSSITTTVPGTLALTGTSTSTLLTNTGRSRFNGNITVGTGVDATGSLGIHVGPTFDQQTCGFGCYGLSSTPTYSRPAGTTLGVGISSLVNEDTYAMTQAWGMVVFSATTTNGGTISANYGLIVQPQTVGTTDYGLSVGYADTQSVWISTDADYTDAAGGIAFGLSRDTNLYRSAANTLKTDDTFVSATGLQGPSLDAVSAGTLSIGTTTATSITFGKTTSTGTITLGQSTDSNTINIGNATTATGKTQTINIGTNGTGTGKSTITIGNGSGATSVAIQCGSGDCLLGNNAVAHDVFVGNQTGATSITAQCGTGACQFGANATDHTTNLGSKNGTSITNIQAGTGGLNLGVDGVAHTITIGDTTGTSTTSVFAGSGGVKVKLLTTASTTAVCSSLANATSPTSTVAYELRDCSGAPAADFAEMYPAAGDVEVGDVVAQGSRQVNTYNWSSTDSSVDWNSPKGKISQIVKATTPYDSRLMGVASDNYLDFASTGYNIKDSDNPKSIALIGRVNVKVTTENGAIEPGDFLTASATRPGYAMKATQAGSVIGQALAPFSDTNPGLVMVFVNGQHYSGPEVASLSNANVNISGNAAYGDLTVTGTANVMNLIVSGSTTLVDVNVTGAATIKDLVVTGSLTAEELHVKGTTKLDGNVGIGGHISTSNTSGSTTVTAGPAACGGTVSIDGNDSSGTITVTTGNGCSAKGKLATINFAKNFAGNPKVSLTPANADATDLKYYQNSVSSTSWSLGTNSVPNDSTSYTYNYFVVG